MSEAPTVAAGTPKLLELDKRDVEAVRSFLPGKVLGRTAALLALVLLVLGFAESLDVAVEKFFHFPLETPWLKYTVLIGLPVLIVCAQILAEWQAERKRKQAQALAVKVDAVPEGYFRIGPYLDTAEDRAKFDRADRIHEKVLAWIKRADATPLYLTGDSGSGKSSVLSAFAMPALREAGWTVVEARAWQDPEAALSEAIKKLAEAKKWRPGEAKTLRGLLEALAKRADEKVLLVLDQFEEFFILAGSDRQKAFTAFLDDLRLKPIKGLKLLLVLRSDYKTAIDELALPLLRQGENWQEVGRFTIAAGAKFMTRSGLALRPDALDRIATSASELDDSPGMIRPITLNVVGHVLSQGRASAPALDASVLVRRYIEQSVEQPAIREIAPRVLKELVSEQGTKRPRSEQDLIEGTRLRPGEVRAVMNGLSAAALARPLDAAQGVWELSHDFVADAVSRYLGRRRHDWPGLVRGYAAPALFGLVAAAVAGAVLWNAGASDRLRAQLAELGIEVLSTSKGLEAIASSRLKSDDSLPEAARLLSKLTALQSLDLSDTRVDDIAPLRALTALKTLNLAQTVVTDSETLSSHLADIEPLRGLTALRWLGLSGTKVANIEPLGDLNALRLLDLSNTEVADLAALEGLTALESFNFSSTRVADIAPLKALTALQTLNLSNTQIADIAPLKALTALQTLDLSHTHVADIAPLKALTALQTLVLSNTQVADLAPLKGLTALHSLSLSSPTVADLAPLKGLTALQSLDLSSTSIADIAPLKDLIALQWLDLSQTQVVDIAPLKDLTALQTLNLSQTQVANIAPLKDLTALQWLDLSQTKLADIAPLKDLTALRLLNLSETQVANIAPLKDLTALRTLNLSQTQVVDLSPVQDLPRLTTLTGGSEQNRVKINAYRARKGLPGLTQ